MTSLTVEQRARCEQALTDAANVLAGIYQGQVPPSPLMLEAAGYIEIWIAALRRKGCLITPT